MEESQEKSTQQNNGGTAETRIVELETQLGKARQEAAENWNKYLRERAEMENFRKRQERLMSDRIQHQKKELITKLLDVVDNVERALVYQDKMDKGELQQVLRMFQWQMNEILRNEGLNPINAVGETFNPYLHDAIETVEVSDKPEGTVVEEVRKGYTLGNETLRPARVKVSVTTQK
jgi:molecular chaperone GrpE